jgi:hypothetical protein
MVFADFGEIQECSTKEGLGQANQPTLKARMIFTHKAQAKKAVDALKSVQHVIFLIRLVAQ